MEPIKLSTPNDVIIRRDIDKAQEIVQQIEEKLADKSNLDDFSDRVEIIVSGESAKVIRDEIAEKYVQAGWRKVEHQTSSENNERSGLTSFTFYF